MSVDESDSPGRLLLLRGRGRDQFIAEGKVRLALTDVKSGSLVGPHIDDLRGRSVLLATDDQISTAVLLLELDGIARRVLLVPPETRHNDYEYIYRLADAEFVIASRPLPGCPPAGQIILPQPFELQTAEQDRTADFETSWILLTSGTSGGPKLVEHTLCSLTAAIQKGPPADRPVVWSTFYDIRRYGGLQILLRALLTGSSLVLRNVMTPVPEFLPVAGDAGVTHISGTPSHWRLAIMSPAASAISPEYIRLSGEIADQAILDALHATWPDATIAHAFASTEAGVAFEVRDGKAGFPASFTSGPQPGGVQIQVRDGLLRIRSGGAASRYLGTGSVPTIAPDGFVDTGDIVELQADRYHFAGRRDGVVNIGGMKVHPEEVEGVINRHPRVYMSLVRTRKSRVTGSLIVADVVLKTDATIARDESSAIEADIRRICFESLPRHKVPGLIHIVQSLPIGNTGKIARSHA